MKNFGILCKRVRALRTIWPRRSLGSHQRTSVNGTTRTMSCCPESGHRRLVHHYHYWRNLESWWFGNTLICPKSGMMGRSFPWGSNICEPGYSLNRWVPGRWSIELHSYDPDFSPNRASRGCPILSLPVLDILEQAGRIRTVIVIGPVTNGREAGPMRATATTTRFYFRPQSYRHSLVTVGQVLFLYGCDIANFHLYLSNLFDFLLAYCRLI